MRSALYRSPYLLKQARIRVAALPRLAATHVRLWSSETGNAETTDARFPLYRPSEEQIASPQRFRQPSHANLPSDRRIQQTVKAQLTEKAIEDLPELQEDELRDFYAAVMESGKEESESRPMIEAPRSGSRRVMKLSAEEKRSVIDGMAGRLLSPSDQAGPSKFPAQVDGEYTNVRKIVGKLRDLTDEHDGEAPAKVSLGLVSRTEWDVLLDETARGGSAIEAEAILSLMSSHGALPSVGQVTRVMELFADEGRPTDVARLHDNMRAAGLNISDRHQDLLIQAHLTHSPPLTHPAINLLSSLASSGTPLPQSSYQILLAHLTSSPSSARNRALAQDLFANMRLTAHPTPTAEVYSTMISACADSRDPQPERARDLWIEMTESGIKPQRREYDAIVRALSSTKKTYLEAFDLLRQMLAKHAEATFVPFDESDQNIEKWSRYVPTAETFQALLEGTKRAGDLYRARWVLNEVVRLQASGLGRDWGGPDAELLSGVFMTYASWKPVVRRTGVRQAAKANAIGEGALPSTPASDSVTDGHQTTGPGQAGEVGSAIMEDATGTGAITTDNKETPYAAPISSADALREAGALFDRILTDNASPSEGGPFARVRLTPRLVNSYLSVHLAHATNISAARKAWDRTWITCAKRDILPNGWSTMHVLERCATGDIGADREAALKWAEKTWTQYTTYAKAHGLDFTSVSALPPPSPAADVRRELYLVGLGPRQIERSFRAMIRIKALSPSHPVTDSLTLLAQFHTLFPPSSILQTYTPTTPTPFQIRMTDPTATSESDIPPVILWPDVDVLHQRLAREGRRKDIGWLTWVCKSYEVNIRKRRRWRLKRRGERKPRSPAEPAGSDLSTQPERAPSDNAGEGLSSGGIAT